jgi:hypothetical protein
MASYTDIIPQFNPYIQQLPVEAMVSVGMEKQKRYDEGIQKIQTQIDNIAGLDVVRDVDKSYLQSKLNELGNNLRNVAAGDFSNFQLVNSVGGMVTQVGKDAVIQNAVSSTAWYRKQMAEMEKAISDGKSSVQNQWDFNQRASRWLSSGDINQSFRDRYTQYIDVDKKWLDTLKAINPNLKEQDIPYVLDSVTGRPDYNKIAAAMERVSTEKVSAAQIENAIRASLTPDDLNQMAINGRYQFRGYDTPDKLAVYSESRYKAELSQIDNNIKTLQGIANASSSQPAEKDLALRTIKQLEERKTQAELEKDQEIAMIRANPEEAKATIYKNGAISQFANAFSWEKSKINVMENPVLKAKHWEQEFALDQSKFRQQQAEFSWKQKKDMHDMALEDAKYKLAFDKQQIELYGMGSDFTVYGGQSTKVKDPVAAMRSDANNKEQFANSIINRMVGAVPNTNANMWKVKIAEYQNGNVNAIPVEWRDDVDLLLENQREARRLNTAIKQAEQSAERAPDVLAARQQINRDLATLPTLRVGNTTFSQRELLDYLSKEQYLKGASGTGGAGKTSIVVDQSRLTDKERILYNYRLRGTGDTNIDNVIGSAFRRYSDVTAKNRDITKKVNDAVYNELLSKTGAYIPMMSNITVTDKEGGLSRNRFENIAMSALMKFDSDFSGIPGGSEMLSKDEATTARGWLAGKEKGDIQYKRLVQGGTTYLVLVKGGEEKFIPLTPEEAAQVPTSSQEPSYLQKQVTTAQHLGNGNTNTSGMVDDAFFQRNNFANLRNLSAVADLQWNQSNHSKNYLNLNLKLPSGWKNLQIDNNPMDARQAIQFINNLTDEKLKQLYLADPRIPEEWKQEIRSLK